MSTIEIIALVFIAINVLYAGILLGSPGESRTFSYGERWATCLWAFMVWAGLFYLAP